MSNITQRINNFIEGISQQPPMLRHPEQLEEQLNGFSTEAGGLQKRPPTVSIGKLFTNTAGDKFYVHIINRDEVEQYIVFINTTKRVITVYDLQGKQIAVNMNDADYLSGITNPYSQLRVMTVADYTFVLNKTKTVQMSGNKTPDTLSSQGALINVKQGQYGRTYTVTINGTQVASFTTPNGSDASHVSQINTDYIRDKLAEGITSKGYTVDKGSSWLRVRGTIKSIATSDSFNNSALIGFTSYVNKFTDLPASAPDGYTVMIRGETNVDDDYYVAFSASENIWKETVRPGIDNTIKATTMPHALVREANGTFSFKPLEWADRETGDEDSNEAPSFVGATINDVFFYRNRLGFLSGENIILSSSSDVFNFWFQSVVDVQDDDTIDTNAPNNKVSILYNAVPFSGSLYIFSGQTQFSLDSDGTLSPKNAKLVNITEFTSDVDVPPVGAGNSVYFVSKRADYANVQEYRVAQYYTDVKDADEVTSHAPYYIPNDVYRMAGNSNEKLLILLSTKDPCAMYVYKYLYMNGNRAQSSWSKWTFAGEILGVDYIGSTMYMAVQYPGSKAVYLEKLTLSYNTEDFSVTEPYRVMLDRKTEVTLKEENCETDAAGQYISLYIDKVYDLADVSKVCVLTSDGLLYESDIGENVIRIRADDTTKIGSKVIVGIPYTFSITLSTIFLKQRDQSGATAAVPSYRLVLRNVFFDYSQTGYMKVCVNDKYQYILTNKKIGDYKLGSVSLLTGTFRVPIRKKNTEVKIQVINDTPLPLSIIGGGYEANYTTRYRSY